jgi:acyl-CoA hydrolase
MKSRFLVRSEHLNHHGHLFGGDLMAEIDNIGYCLVREQYGEKVFVTRASQIDFERPASLGDVITFQAQVLREGTTSLQVEVSGRVEDTPICKALLIFVNIGPDGNKTPIKT